MFLAVTRKEPIACATIERALCAGDAAPAHVQFVESLGMALARLAGGSVDGVLLDISEPALAGADRMQGFLRIRAGAGGAPILLLCDSADEELARHIVKAGASGYVVRGCPDDLSRALAAIARPASARLSAIHRDPPHCSQMQIAVLGAKGGVGATTVALNVAAALAWSRSVILVEMRSELGSLGAYFSEGVAARNLGHLAQSERITPALAQACLWRCPDAPRLRILFAPPGMKRERLTPEQAGGICTVLSGLAECVVVDLPDTLSDVNRAVIEASDRVAVVLEREPVCVAVAAQTLKGIRSWSVAPDTVLVIVNRTPLSLPVPILKIEADLDARSIGAFPPAPDLCVRGQCLHQPALILDRGSLFAQSAVEVAGRLASDEVGGIDRAA